MASTPACLSVAPLSVQAWAPVMLPIVDYCVEERISDEDLVEGVGVRVGVRAWAVMVTSAAPLTYCTCPPIRPVCCCWLVLSFADIVMSEST